MSKLPSSLASKANLLNLKVGNKAAGPGGRSSVQGLTATVFGCTGFLGRYLVNQLGKHGVTVVVPYRGSQEDPRHLKVMGDLGQIVPLRFDTRDKESLVDCVKHSDIVYNLIGRDYETRNFDFQAVHVDAARNIASACQEVGVRRFVHVSSINADPKSSSEFFKTKGEGELAVRYACPDAVIVRPGTMYGWEDRLLQYLGNTVTHPVKRWLTGGFIPMLDGGKRTFYPVYVNDVARGLYQFAVDFKQEPKPLYEFIGPKPITYLELADLFCEYSRRPFSPLPLSYKTYRSIISLTQKNPLARVNVHDVDRWMFDDVKTEDAGSLQDVGVGAQSLESLAIRFIRHYRSERWVDQPATMEELNVWEKQQSKN